MGLVTEPLNARARERLLTLATDLKGDDPLALGARPYRFQYHPPGVVLLFLWVGQSVSVCGTVGVGRDGENRSQFEGYTVAGINGVGELVYTLCNGAKGI